MLDLTINPSPVFSFTQDTVGACGGDSVLLDVGMVTIVIYGAMELNSSSIYASSTGTYSGFSIGDGQLFQINNRFFQWRFRVCRGSK